MVLEKVRWMMAVAATMLLAEGSAMAAEEMLVAATTDYASGNVTTLMNGGSRVAMDLLPIHPDNGMVAYGEYIYVLEKFGADNVLKVKADEIAPSGVVYQYSVGNGANPQNMVFLSDRKAYVSRYDDAMLWIVDPGATSAKTFKMGEVDLSVYADGDGLPEMAPMALVGDKLYVGCQRIDRDGGWAPLDAQVVIIDTATDEVTGVIALQKGNPQAMVAYGGKLYVTSGGSLFDPTDGGIEVIDTATDTYAGLRLTESDLGGNVGELLFQSATKGYVIVGAYVQDESGNWVPSYVVQPFDPSTGTVGAALPGSKAATSIALGGSGVLYVADRSPEQPGIYMYDAEDHLIAGPIATGLPPNALVVVGGAPPTAVVEEMSRVQPKTHALSPNYPNPFNAGTVIPYVIAGSGSVEVDLGIYTALGQRMATLVQGTRPAGRYLVHWDGRDRAGQPVASGVYVARLNAGGAVYTVKLVLTR